MSKIGLPAAHIVTTVADRAPGSTIAMAVDDRAPGSTFRNGRRRSTLSPRLAVRKCGMRKRRPCKLTALTDLNGNFCDVSDLAPVSGLKLLGNLSLTNNAILDLAPLVTPGLQAGAKLDVSSNPFDCTLQSSNLSALKANGVTVTSSCP